MRIRAALAFLLAAFISFAAPPPRRRRRPRQSAQTAASRIREPRSADVDARRRRASRPPRGIHRRRLRRQSRGSLLAESLSRHGQVLDEAVAERSGAGTGRARRGAERRHYRRALPRSVRPAARARRRRQLREEPLRACAEGGRSSCSAISGSSGTATGSTPRARSMPCAASSDTRNCGSMASPPRSSTFRWTT